MSTPLDLEIRTRIAAVLSGDVPLRDFYYWFVPATLEVERHSEPEAARLTYTIAHLFAELSAGDISPREFKRDLQLAASTYLTIETPWNRAASTPTMTTNANDIIEDEPTVFVLRKRRAEAIA